MSGLDIFAIIVLIILLFAAVAIWVVLAGIVRLKRPCVRNPISWRSQAAS